MWMVSSHEVGHVLDNDWLFIELTNCILLVQRELINKEWCNHFEFTAFHTWNIWFVLCHVTLILKQTID